VARRERRAELPRRGRFRLFDVAGEVEERRQFVRGDGGDADYWRSSVRKAKESRMEYSRLKDDLSEPFRILASCLEAAWCDKLCANLPGGEDGAVELEGADPLGRWAFLDSARRSRRGAEWARDNPEARALGPDTGPRLLVENVKYQSAKFRDIHMELASREDGLEVLHVVVYPRVRYALPIFALDMVGMKGEVSYCIADVAPVAPGGLPPGQAAEVRGLQAMCFGADGPARLPLPAWGAAILSPDYVALRPKGPEDVNRFVQYGYALLSWYLMLQREAPLLGTDAAVAEVFRRHAEFGRRQLENQKTAAVLARAFGPRLAARYMREVMFTLEQAFATPEAAGAAGADEVAVVGGKAFPVTLGALARVELDGATYWVPKGAWTPGEDIARLEAAGKPDMASAAFFPVAAGGPAEAAAAEVGAEAAAEEVEVAAVREEEEVAAKEVIPADRMAMPSPPPPPPPPAPRTASAGFPKAPAFGSPVDFPLPGQRPPKVK